MTVNSKLVINENQPDQRASRFLNCMHINSTKPNKRVRRHKDYVGAKPKLPKVKVIGKINLNNTRPSYQTSMNQTNEEYFLSAYKTELDWLVRLSFNVAKMLILKKFGVREGMIIIDVLFPIAIKLMDGITITRTQEEIQEEDKLRREFKEICNDPFFEGIV